MPINSPARYRKLFDAVGLREFKAIFDPAHFDVLNGLHRHLEDLLLEPGASRIGYVQFCDGVPRHSLSRTAGPVPRGTCPAATASTTYPKPYSILYEGGIRGCFQVDSWGTEDAYRTSKSCLDAVRGHLRDAA